MSFPFELNVWTGVGMLGQFAFGSRFIIQWIASERRGHSHVPEIFWSLSIVGGAILTVYAVGQRDLVFTLGQVLGLFIYARNVMLIKRHRRELLQARVESNAP